MANTDYKSPDALMRHLRDNGISISGSSQKQQLINTGYFHGYKGYRFLYLPLTDFHSLHIMRLTQPYNMIQN
jgi:hypothetical protein|uniref:hypothetical protein n=1 Tax=Roseburia faecis TaxID=301302 RepID=UPI004027A1DC